MSETQEKQTEPEVDWQGHPVPPGETEGTEILVWQATPNLLNRDYDSFWCRGYRQFCDALENSLIYLFDDVDPEVLLSDGVTLNVKLAKTTLGEYQAAIQND